MTNRLLLGEDLSLYRDGSQPGPEKDPPPERSPSEVPYHDARMHGRVLEIGGDGLLVWNLRAAVPVADGRYAGAALLVDDDGSLVWRRLPAGVSDEVFATDLPDATVQAGTFWYGPTDPIGGTDGDIWIVTRTSVTTPPVIPPSGQPVVTVVSPATSTSVPISWTSVAAATAYRINIDNADVAQTPNLSYTVTLAPGTHSIKVRGTNNGGDGPASNAVSVVVPNQAPDPVTNLRVTAITASTLAVAWDYPSPPSDFQSYIVTSTGGTVGVTGTTATVSGLAASTAYTISVKARDTGGLDSSTVSVVGTTAAPPPPAAPDPPTGFHATRIGYSSADFVWNGSAGATSYQVSGDGVGFGDVGNVGSWGWGGLAEQTNYRLYLRAVGPGGASAAVSVAFTTLPRIAYWTNTFAERRIGYGGEDWNNATIGYESSGVLFTTDHWATGGNSHLYALDLNLNTGPFSQQGDRWITFSIGLFVDYIYDVTGWWGYPGTFRWQAYADGLAAQQQGAIVGGGGAMAVGPNEVNNAREAVQLKHLQMYYAPGQGSPGWYKLREFQIHVRQVTGQTPVYNPA